MGGLLSLLSRKKKKKQDNNNATQPLAAAGKSVASKIGNQAMLDMVSSNKTAGGTKKAGSDELGEKIRANLPALKAAREMAEIQDSPEMARTTLSELYAKLKTSERGGMFTGSNSEYYEAVMSSLRSINTAMKQSFSQDVKENQKKLIDMEHRYQELIDACAAYTARDPRSRAGKHRKELVTIIQTRASTDLMALGAVRTDFCTLPPQEQSSKNWNELLDQSRTIHLSVSDYSALGKATGGQASEVFKLDNSNARVFNASGETVELGEMQFFKPEDKYDMTKSNIASKAVENVLSRYPELTKNDKKTIRKWAASLKDDDILDKEKADAIKKKLSEKGKEVLYTIWSNLGGVKTNTTQLAKDLGIDNQDTINMTRRNVATSRVAALLGIGDLVAESETAELYDEKSGQSIRGNLMKKAKGSIEAGKFGNIAQQESAQQKLDKKDVAVKVSGGFQRDICNLQVLDAICGQIDRHTNNYYISQTDNGEVCGLQAIDNDAAFGTRERATLALNQEGKGRAIYDLNTGEMTLPYMDKNLAERIKALDPDMMRFALKDLIKDEEIEAAIKRLEHTKEAIRKTEKTQPERLLEDSQWNDDTAQEMINQAWERSAGFWQGNTKENKDKVDDTLLHQNYFGNFIFNTLRGAYTVYLGKGEAPQIRRRKEKA